MSNTTETNAQSQLFAAEQAIIFTPRLQDDSVETKIEAAVEALVGVFRSGRALSVSFSGGKDSSVLMHLAIEAAKLAKVFEPKVVVLSSDTGVENPEVATLLRREHDKIRKALTAAGVAHEVHLTQPSLASSWAVRVLGGTKLPSFPGSSHDCAVDLKVAPMASLRKSLFKSMGKNAVVTAIGTRYEESAQRGKAMAERGELAHEPYPNADGEMVISPIAFWTTDDVWEFIGLVRAEAITSYSDFEDTFKLYADAGGTSCAVVSDAITEGAKSARGGCGARFGCFSCQAVSKDTSLQTMIEADPEYAYMQGLSDLRTLIASTRWDYSKRYWVQRTLRDGEVVLQPDCYSPAFLHDLFRYAVTLDEQERRAAARKGIPPRFCMVTPEAMVAIDALWSLNGFHAPHTALFTYLEITEGTMEYPVPTPGAYAEAARQTVPAPVRIAAGEVWDGDEINAFSGTRSVGEYMADCFDTKVATDGRQVLALETAARMEVDLESLYLALDFEAKGFRQRNRESAETSDWTSGYRFWTSYGTLTLSGTQLMEHDNTLRRTAWRARNGFLGEEGNLRAQQLAAKPKTNPTPELALDFA